LYNNLNQLFNKDKKMLKQNAVTKFVKTLIFTLIFSLVSVPAIANAASMFCRSDPIVYLSDGTRLQFEAAIATSQENIQSIQYQLHVPAGITIERIVFTPRWARAIESVELVNDQAAGNYQIDTLVNTGGEAVAVQIHAMQVSHANSGQGSTRQTATGMSGQVIVLAFNR
jgi:hypothetical protein